MPFRPEFQTPFFRVDLVHPAVAGLVEPERVEDVELDLRAPVARRRDAALGEEALRLAADVARVARVRLAAARLGDVAHEDHRRDVERRVDERGRRIRHEQHVALMDVLEAADARPIEADAVDEQVLAQLLDRDREVLGLAGQVDEAEVDHEDAALSGERHHVGDGGRGRGDAARNPLQDGHPISNLHDAALVHDARDRGRLADCRQASIGLGCGSVPARASSLGIVHNCSRAAVASGAAPQDPRRDAQREPQVRIGQVPAAQRLQPADAVRDGVPVDAEP